MKHWPQKVVASLLFFTFAPLISAPIVFDLGDVLIETHYLQSVLTVGPIKMVSYALTLQNPFSCHKKLYQLLDKIKAPDYSTIATHDHHGNRLPQLMVDWLKGELTPEELMSILQRHYDRCDNWIEILLIRALANTIFTPENFAATRYLVPEGIEFVKACRAAGHEPYIISNWDPHSFSFLQEAHPDFFNLFTGIIISGDVGLVKPDPAIYRFLTNYYKLDTTQCYFIDDREENVAAAQELGMNAILYQKKSGLFFNWSDFDTIRDYINAKESLKDFPMLINYNGY